MNKFIRKLQTKCRKIIKKARDLGFSLPIALLIFLTFFSIITVAVIQTRRDTTLTRANAPCKCSYKPTSEGKALCETNCGAGKCVICDGGGGYTCLANTISGGCSQSTSNTNTGVGTTGNNPSDLTTCKNAFFRNITLAKNNCGNGNWRECSRYGAGGYYECIGPASGSGYDSCPTNTFYTQSLCQNGDPKNNKSACSTNCTQCSDDGIHVRWYCGGSGPIAPGGSTVPGEGSPGTKRDCETIYCFHIKINDSYPFRNNFTQVARVKNTGLYFRTKSICENPEKQGQDAGGVCLGSTSTCTQTSCAEQGQKKYGDSNPYKNTNKSLFISDEDSIYDNDQCTGSAKSLETACGNASIFECSPLNCSSVCDNPKQTNYYQGTKNGIIKYYNQNDNAACVTFQRSGTTGPSVDTAEKACACQENDPLEFLDPNDFTGSYTTNLNDCRRTCTDPIDLSTCTPAAKVTAGPEGTVGKYIKVSRSEYGANDDEINKKISKCTLVRQF